MVRGIVKVKGKTIAGSYDSNVYCIDKGSVIWSVPMSASVLDVCGRERIYAVSGFGELFCIDLDGKVIWNKTYDTPLWSCACSVDKVAVGGANGVISVLDTNIKEKGKEPKDWIKETWNAHIKGSVERLSFYNEKVAVASPHETILRVFADGRIYYEEDLGKPVHAVSFLDDGSIVCSAGNSIFMLDKGLSYKWGFDAGLGVRAISACKDIYCGGGNILFCMSRDGKLRWYRREDTEILGIACDEETISICGKDGNIREYSLVSLLEVAKV